MLHVPAALRLGDSWLFDSAHWWGPLKRHPVGIHHEGAVAFRSFWNGWTRCWKGRKWWYLLTSRGGTFSCKNGCRSCSGHVEIDNDGEKFLLKTHFLWLISFKSRCIRGDYTCLYRTWKSKRLPSSTSWISKYAWGMGCVIWNKEQAIMWVCDQSRLQNVCSVPFCYVEGKSRISTFFVLGPILLGGRWETFAYIWNQSWAKWNLCQISSQRVTGQAWQEDVFPLEWWWECFEWGGGTNYVTLLKLFPVSLLWESREIVTLFFLSPMDLLIWCKWGKVFDLM